MKKGQPNTGGLFYKPVIQFNEYETAPIFIQLSQNVTLDCLLISVFLPVFTSFCMI